MAHVSVNSAFVTQGVAGETITEGAPVCITTSGVHMELPVAMLADTTTTKVFVAIVPPDQYGRPTPVNMYLTPSQALLDVANANSTPVSGGEMYLNQGMSTLENPVVMSGMLLQIHDGGAYTIPADLFDAVPAIGEDVVVSSAGKWGTTGGDKVGIVREIRGNNVVIVLR